MQNGTNGNGQPPTVDPQKQLAITRMSALQAAIQDSYVQGQLKAALAENAGSFTASIVEIFSQDKYLQECDPKQVIMQCIKAAILKLPLSKQLGQAWVIAYKKVPTFQIGYKGLIQLAYRTKAYRVIHCDEVYEGEYQSANKLTGEFDLSGTKKSEKIIGYFAHFEFLWGLSKTWYMTTEQVQKHAQRYSKSYNSDGSTWKSDFPGMAKKTVLRLLLSHWGLLSIELASAMTHDEDYDPTNDEVQDEIRRRANIKTEGFTDAETVPEGKEPENQGSTDSSPKPPF